MIRPIVLIVLLSLFSSNVRVQGEEQVPFLSPADAIKKMTFGEGYEVTAFAAEPDVVQPFAFTFDDRGRIWVCENLNYETRGSDLYHLGPKGRILILEDADGDGVFDKKTLFRDEILFPTGLAVGHGGVWVGSPPNLLFIPDRDGDDVPDGEPEIVLDGWGRNDRHETLNSFLWGPDGWLYGCHGVFTHSNVGKPGTPADQRQPINAGVWRYHPISQDFEVFAWGTSNPWGLDFDDHGQAFVTACVIPHLWHLVQGGRFHRQAGSHFGEHTYDDIKTVADHRHKSAHGGARFYLADAFPQQYHRRIFMCNIHEHNVLTDILERRGSGFIGLHGDEFLASNDPQWLGFNMEIVPDGALYIIDWHDADICGRKIVHGETGRIWRIGYQGKRLPTDLHLSALSDSDLVALHMSNNDWYVRTARRILHERAVAGTLTADTHASLKKVLQNHPESARKLRALWSLHVTGGAGDAFLATLLDHEDEYVRAWAIQLLAEDKQVDDAVRAKWSVMAREDTSALVRLYLASALQRLPVTQRWDVLAGLTTHAEDADDHNLPLMIWYALEPCVPTDNSKALALAKTNKIPVLTSYIARRIASGNAPPRPPAPAPRPGLVRVKPAKEVSRDGLILHYQVDGVVESDKRISQWTDATREGRNAAQRAVSAQPRLEQVGGKPALQFDGVDDHFVLGHDSQLAFGKDESYSLAAWVYVKSSAGGWQGIVTKGRESGKWYGIWTNKGQWIFGTQGDNLSGGAATSGWHHVCVTQDKSARRIYIDGALAATSQRRDASGDGELWIGGAASVNEFFHGAIRDVQLYSRALTHPEVAKLAITE